MRRCAYPNMSPFYIFPMLERMLTSSDAGQFHDRNLDYVSRMLADMTNETVEYAKMYIGTAIDLNVPKRFIDPSIKTWEGAAPNI